VKASNCQSQCVYQGRARKLTPEQVADAQHLVISGVPKAKVARDVGCSRRVLYDALNARGAYAPRDGPDSGRPIR
jgi:DNA-binding phage protein